MDKQFFQRMFCATAGRVYKFVGEIPTGQAPSVYLTEQFLGLVSSPASTSTVVVDVQGQLVLFTNTTEDVVADSFVLLADLTPDAIEVAPEVAPAPEGGV